METWRSALNGDPLPWLLERETPAVRQMALRVLEDEPWDAPRVRRARAAAMRTDPIAAILANQHPEGWWVKPGAGYGPKYRGTVWSLILLDQLGADGRHVGIRAASDYVLSHSQASSGGFGVSASRQDRSPPPSSIVHCLNGNLLRALLGFGRLDDPRLQRAIDWQARSITGEGFEDFHASGTSGPDFGCAVNGKLPCGWGAIKALRGLARIPPRRRSRHVRRAIDRGWAFLLSRDLATADYPTDTKVSSAWFKLGFPSGYVADVLQNLEVLCELGCAQDRRLGRAIDLVLSKQDAQGRWRNEYAYNGRMWSDIERQGAPSKWVSLRACAVLRQTLG